MLILIDSYVDLFMYLIRTLGLAQARFKCRTFHECPDLNASALIKDVRKYQRLLKTTFSKFAQKHSPCLELCMAHAFDSCSEEHSADVAEISLVYEVHNSHCSPLNLLSCHSFVVKGGSSS